MKGRKLRSDRKHVNQQLRQFVKEQDDETDYAIMNLPSTERISWERIVSEAEGGNHGNNTRRR